MLLKCVLTLLQNLNLVLQLSILMHNFLLLEMKFLKMCLSREGFPSLEVAVEGLTVFRGQCVTDSVQDVIFVGYEVFPKLESEELVVHVS